MEVRLGICGGARLWRKSGGDEIGKYPSLFGKYLT